MASKFTEEQDLALRALAELAGMKSGVSRTTRAIGERLGWPDERVVRVLTELQDLGCVGQGRVN